MILWFVVVAPILVAEVFQSPRVDYRLVSVGALLPLVEVVGVPFVALHTLLAPVLVLTLVMAATSGRRLLRRRLIGIPIGLFLHLVLDATFTVAELFWWPAFSVAVDRDLLPEVGRPILVGLALDAVAVIAAWWAVGRYDLRVAENRSRLLATGHLAPETMRSTR